VSQDYTIDENTSLLDAINRLEACQVAFTIFATNSEGHVSGVLSRGDVLRHIARIASQGTALDLSVIKVRDAMTPRVQDQLPNDRHMLFISTVSEKTWYDQLTDVRKQNHDKWRRLRLLPVLDEDCQLVNVIDLESSRTRTRLEAIIMAQEFALSSPSYGIAERRADFDSIHYDTRLRKLQGICKLFENGTDGFKAMCSVFENARADELLHTLAQAEEWTKGYICNSGSSTGIWEKLKTDIPKLRAKFAEQYARISSTKTYPSDFDRKVLDEPEIIVVLGSNDKGVTEVRVQALTDLFVTKKLMSPPTLVLSGGGVWQGESEASFMLKKLQNVLPRMTLSLVKDGWYKLIDKDNNPRADVVLEEDSLDTLGNAVFTWLTLKREDRYGLVATSTNKLQRLLIVTDGLHAPRSYDVFRRVFAFRTVGSEPEAAPNMAVKVAAPSEISADALRVALDHMRSEARTNNEIFRLSNPLASGFDVIGDGHVRSILSQMIRLHERYRERWDLVRKYHSCLEN
jgi:CBS domain-containing protein